MWLLEKAKQVAKEDPRRITHSFKVAFALLLISIFYYFRPTFRGFGNNTIWAVITVVVVMEFSVGATLGKGLNRLLATLIAGSLGVGLRFIADVSGETGEMVIIPLFVSVSGGVVTFLRFFPELKTRYDYGLIMFLVTICMVSVSGYRENELLNMAQERVLTIILGSFIAVFICVFICPVWNGQDLHNLLASNLEKLALFFQGFGDAYFNTNFAENKEGVDDNSFLEKYKTVLSSKGNEETMANLAKWEPPHGKFRFRHPWIQYLKVGNVIRLCAYKIEALNALLHSSEQSPHEVRSKIQEASTEISSESERALKELSIAVKKMKMTEPCMSNTHMRNAKNAAETLKAILKANPWEGVDLLEIIPAATVASLLIDVVICIEEICEAVDELASLARFKSTLQATEHTNSQLLRKGTVQPIGGNHVVTVGGGTDE